MSFMSRLSNWLNRVLNLGNKPSPATLDHSTITEMDSLSQSEITSGVGESYSQNTELNLPVRFYRLNSSPLLHWVVIIDLTKSTPSAVSVRTDQDPDIGFMNRWTDSNNQEAEAVFSNHRASIIWYLNRELRVKRISDVSEKMEFQSPIPSYWDFPMTLLFVRNFSIDNESNEDGLNFVLTYLSAYRKQSEINDRILGCYELVEMLPQLTIPNPRPVQFSDLSVNKGADEQNLFDYLDFNVSLPSAYRSDSDNSLDKLKPVDYSRLDNPLVEALINYQRTNLVAFLQDGNFSSLSRRLKNGPLLGIDLLPFLNNPEMEKRLHEMADHRLLLLLYGQMGELSYPVIAISLSCIAARHYYDRQFYPFTKKLYWKTYRCHSEAKIISLIRTIAKYYSGQSDVFYYMRQAIFPQKYLKDAIRLAEALYRGPLNYHVPDHMEAEMIDLFRNYKQRLIKRHTGTESSNLDFPESVKWVLEHESHYPELIDYLTVVLKCLDTYYWNTSTISCEYYGYFLPQIQEYCFERKIKHNGTRGPRVRSNQKPSIQYRLKGTDLYLRISGIPVPEENLVHPIDLVTRNQDQILAKKEDLTIISEGNQYLLKPVQIKVDSSVGKLHCKIFDRTNHKILYFSENKLYRDFLIFNEDGKEVRKDKIKFGNYVAVTNSQAKTVNMKLIDQTDVFSFWEFSIQSYDDYVYINNQIILVEQKDILVLEGEKSVRLRISDGQKTYAVYKSLQSARVTTLNENPNNIYMLVDEDYRCRAIPENPLFSEQSPSNTCIFNLKDIKSPGYHSIRFFSTTEKYEILRSEFFIADVDDVIIEPIKDEYSVVIFNNLIGSKDDDNEENNGRVWEGYLNLLEPEILPLRYQDSHFAKPLKIHIDLDRFFYRIATRDNNNGNTASKWVSFEKPILSSELDADSRIYFEGPGFDQINIVTGSEILFTLPVAKDVNGNRWITAAFLSNLPDEISKTHILLLNNNKVVNYIKYFKRTSIIKESVETNFDYPKGVENISFVLAGPDPATVRILHKQECIFEKQIEPSDFQNIQTISFPALSLKTYILEIEAGSNDLFSLNYDNYLVFKTTIRPSELDSAHWKSYYPDRVLVEGDESFNLGGEDCRIYVGEEVKPNLFNGLLLTRKGERDDWKQIKIDIRLLKGRNRSDPLVFLTSRYGEVFYDFQNNNLAVVDISRDTEWAMKYIHVKRLNMKKLD